MKKILWFLFSLALAAGLGGLLYNAWGTTKFFQEHGREARLMIGAKYNASRWAEPVPIKKIHSYVAIMAPNHELVIESDQSLKEKQEYFIRFLLRDGAETVRKHSLRPLIGTLRLKSEADGTPVKLSDTNIFDRTLDKAMGPAAEGVYVAPIAVAEAGPTRDKPTVPFVIAGSQDSTLEILWNNSSIGELILVGIWIIVIKMVFLHAWVTPFKSGHRPGMERKDFVHPSMRRIEPDPRPTASAKIGYEPKPQEQDYRTPPTPPPAPVSSAPPPAFVPPAPVPKATPIQLPPGAKSPTAPRTPAEPYSTSTTAPFVPAEGATEPTLKLARKPKLAATPPTENPPPGTAT